MQLSPPSNVKGCKSFCGIVNFLAIFCPELQLLLKPIYALTCKDTTFRWTSECNTNFEEIK